MGVGVVSDGRKRMVDCCGAKVIFFLKLKADFNLASCTPRLSLDDRLTMTLVHFWNSVKVLSFIYSLMKTQSNHKLFATTYTLAHICN